MELQLNWSNRRTTYCDGFWKEYSPFSPGGVFLSFRHLFFHRRPLAASADFLSFSHLTEKNPVVFTATEFIVSEA